MNRTCFIFGVLGLGICVSTRAFGETIQSSQHTFADLQPAAQYRQSHDQFQRAQEFASQRQLEVTSSQQKLDDLLDQKAVWQREILNAKAKMGVAKENLNHATTTANLDEIKKYQSQYDSWEKRLRAAVIEMENTESSIADAVNSLRGTVRGKTDSDLILPGESVEVFVAEDESFHQVYAVRQGGYIIMPHVGRVSIAGLNLLGAEKVIKDALAVDQIKDATVLVERPQGGGIGAEPIIYLAGEFIKPGAWKVPLGLSPTLVTTILRSGGLTKSADLTKVRLLRLVGGQSLAEEINVQAILNGSGSGLPSDVALQNGDVLMVPAFANVVYVTGNVMRPGVLRLQPDDELTVYSAILRAGGFSRFANKKKIYVLRELGNGDKQKVPVDIDMLQSGGGGDLVLKSKDIVVVPEKFFSF